MAEDTKTCPYCAETIKAMAIVCRFCNRDLAGSVTPTPSASQIVRDGDRRMVPPAAPALPTPQSAKSSANNVVVGIIAFIAIFAWGVYSTSNHVNAGAGPAPDSTDAAQDVVRAQQAVDAAAAQSAAVSTTADLEPKNVSVITDGASEYQVLSGYVINTSGRALRYIEANAEFQDKKGNVVATAMDNEGDTIQPGEKWRFKIMWPTDNSAVKTGRVTSVKGTFQ